MYDTPTVFRNTAEKLIEYKIPSYELFLIIAIFKNSKVESLKSTPFIEDKLEF